MEDKTFKYFISCSQFLSISLYSPDLDEKSFFSVGSFDQQLNYCDLTLKEMKSGKKDAELTSDEMMTAVKESMNDLQKMKIKFIMLVKCRTQKAPCQNE